MFSSTPAERAAFIRRRHQATSHARGPACHCSPELGRPDPGSGLHVVACRTCDSFRSSPAGQAEKAYWAL